MVLLHPSEDVRERGHRLVDEGTLVWHHALCRDARGCVGDIGSRRHGRVRERVENLRGPDRGHVAGLAKPQDLLLQLGEALEPDLDRQVAPRDHDG
jgi:hypothetical protein